MEMKPKKITKFHIIAVLLAATMISFSAIGAVWSKYVKDITFTGKVTVSAELAASLEVVEHKAIQNKDGSYALDMADEEEKNTYVILPGVDIPKDPFVRLTDKTAIEGYLYIEVTESTVLAPYIEYELNENWLDLGVSGRSVYVYSEDGVTPAKITGTGTGITTYPIIKGNILTISDKIKYKAGDVFGVTFTAYMAQAADLDAKSAFEKAGF